MPIRMVKDPGGDDNKKRPGGGGTSGGGGSIGSIIGVLLPFLFRSPKLLFGIAIIAALFYFLGGGGLFSGSVESLVNSLGCEMKQEVYDRAEVFEPLADNSKNPMPERVSLEKYCPERLNQGYQGSCVAWASSYAARTILQSRATGQDPDKVAFSPSYLYNQIALPNCQGSYINLAMDKMYQEGVLPFSEFGYNDQDCSEQPNSTEKRMATNYRTKGFNRLTYGGNNYKTDLLAIKQNLAQGAPVVIGMMVGGSFLKDMAGKRVWFPTQSDYQMRGFGGHAMAVIGYDDYLEGGAFQIMNSWGMDWGQKGIGWVRYEDFDFFTKEAYGLYPMGSSEKFDESKFALEFGLRDNETGQNIALEQTSGLGFTTRQPIKKGTKFKVEVTNSIECYIYVFGQETDGSSYVLFPYTEKHSPYCGITGTRLFPKDYSMQADEVGTRDKIAIVISKQAFDYKKLNEYINSSSQGDYEKKFLDVLGSELVPNVTFKSGNTISFQSETANKNAVAMLIEVEKY